MVKKTKGLSKGSKSKAKEPVNLTGYPLKKPCNCPAEILSKTAGGGKASAS